MKLVQTTPVPNVVIDQHLKILNLSELKVLMVVIRKTLGWKAGANGRKERDWISSGQLSQITGLSKRAITGAISSLLDKNLIKITGSSNRVLNAPSERRGQTRLFFELSGNLVVDNECRNRQMEGINEKTSENYAVEIGKKVHELAKKLLITKETVQN